jgi:gamma-glutamylcyclotransferase (GGCT)/AIG2-like uncharacterized protein YtfP
MVKSIPLFVYGTLKRGDVRAPLLTGQMFLENAETTPLYRLFNVGTYPAMVEAEPLGMQGLAIQGELWHVDEACLERLDIEEGIDEALYERKLIRLTDGQQAWSYLFLHPVDGLADCGDRWVSAS